jgi:hypothetical protein
MLPLMAQVLMAPGERSRIERIATELDATTEEFFGDVRSSLSHENWALLTGYARACIRRALEVGIMLHAVVDAQTLTTISYAGRGREAFVREALAAWRDSFSPVPNIWRLAAIFESIPGGERRVVADVATLEVMAANRMFDSLDDQCATLLPPGN